MKLRRFVTLRWLRGRCACLDAVDAFIDKYGKGGKPTVQNVVKACLRAKKVAWSEWVLDGVLRDDLEDEWICSLAHTTPTTRRLHLRIARLHQRRADTQGSVKGASDSKCLDEGGRP